MANTSDIKNGVCIEHNNSTWKVIEFQHVKPGKGPAFVRLKIKNLFSGKVIDNTIPAGHKVNIVRVENRKYQFLYSQSDTFYFMNKKDFNQIGVKKELIGCTELLKEGEEVEIVFRAEDELIISCELPPNVNLRVLETDPSDKGNTVNNPTKMAKLETGFSISVPLFINDGDVIKVDTEKKSYIERINKK